MLGRNLHATLEYTLHSLLVRGEERWTAGEPHQARFSNSLTEPWRSAMPSRVLSLNILDTAPSKVWAHLDRGLDRAIEYFFGDWWRGDDPMPISR